MHLYVSFKLVVSNGGLPSNMVYLEVVVMVVMVVGEGGVGSEKSVFSSTAWSSTVYCIGRSHITARSIETLLTHITQPRAQMSDSQPWPCLLSTSGDR